VTTTDEHVQPEIALKPAHPLLERLRLGRGWLDLLPPFWIVFGLTISEAIGMNVLVLPAALAGVPLPAALGVLLVFGLVNVATAAAIAAAIAHGASARLEHTFLHGVVELYLGPWAARIFSAVMLVGMVLALPCYYMGFALSIGRTTGLPPSLWALALTAIVMLLLSRGALDLSLGTTLAIGAVMITTLSAVSVLALPHIELARFAEAPQSLALAPLGIGVVLGAFWGHSAAAACAQVVLRRDPSGQSLVRGTAAAIAVLIVANIAWFLVIRGVIPGPEIVSSGASVLALLVGEVGPHIIPLAIVYSILGPGLSSLYQSIVMASIVRELAERGLPRWPVLRRLAPLATQALLCATGLWLIQGDGSVFMSLLDLSSLLSIPLLMGVVPVLMVAQLRRMHAPVVSGRLRVLAHPLTVAALCVFFVATVAGYGLFIWPDAPRRLAVAGICALCAALIIGQVRCSPGGAFHQPEPYDEAALPAR
jgi:hypothetical protein